MIWNNYIGTDFLIPAYICEDIISIGETKFKDNFGQKIKTYRKDESLVLEKFGLYIRSKNFKIINDAIEKSTEEFLDNFAPMLKIESFYNVTHKFQKAEADGGFYSWHCESSASLKNRAFVWMLYLNTVEKGGKTQFWKDKDTIIEVKPEIGKFVFWPAGETHFHRSAPDLKETKYILTGWVLRK
jgi:hypothetical protein